MNKTQSDDWDEDAQAESFFQGLAGRGKAHEGAAAMRATILAESRALQAAHAAASLDAAKRDAQTFAILRNEGVFVEPRAAGAAVPLRASTSSFVGWRERLDRLLAIRGFQPALATLAAVAFLVVIVLDHEAGPADPYAVVRGGAPNTLSVADPEPYAQSVLNDLRAAGAEARLVQINDRTWVISVSASPERAEVAKTVLQRKGWRDVSRLPVELTVTKR